MDYRRQSNGLLTFLEHWWFLSIATVALLASLVIPFFMRLTGTTWIWCYGVGLIVALLGVLMVFYAKLPLYRQRRFVTFGSRALPEGRRSSYRCVTFAIALLLCLLLSNP